MRKKLFAITLICVFAMALINSCKKDSTQTATLDSQVQQHTADANYQKSESDQADDDINNSLNNYPSFGRIQSGSAVLSSPLCGVTIDTTQIASKTLIFNFDGVTPCFSPSRTRSGQIKVQLTTGTHWSDAGSVLTITYINFKVIRLSDNKSIMFNGVKTLKNINGNDWIGFFLSTATLKYQERAFNIAVTFDNGLNATWNSARMTQWNYVQPTTSIPYANIQFTCNGDTSLNGYTTVDSWGTNRYGQSFTTYYQAPLVSNTYCGLWRFNSGQLTYHLNNADYSVTTGLDQNGNATPYACAYGYKVTWTVSGSTHSVILSY